MYQELNKSQFLLLGFETRCDVISELMFDELYKW